MCAMEVRGQQVLVLTSQPFTHMVSYHCVLHICSCTVNFHRALSHRGQGSLIYIYCYIWLLHGFKGSELGSSALHCKFLNQKVTYIPSLPYLPFHLMSKEEVKKFVVENSNCIYSAFSMKWK